MSGVFLCKKKVSKMKLIKIKAYDKEATGNDDEVELGKKREYLVNPDTISYISDVTEQIANLPGKFYQIRLTNDVCLIVNTAELANIGIA